MNHPPKHAAIAVKHRVVRCECILCKKNRTQRHIVFEEKSDAPRPSEHPPVMGGKMSKRLGGIKGCKYKTSYGILTGSPMRITLGQQYNVGEKPTVIPYIYINRHAGTPEKH